MKRRSDNTLATEILRAEGRALRHLRKKAALTQEQLEKRSGVHHGQIGSYERAEQRPEMKSLCPLLDALDVTSDRYMETVAFFSKVGEAEPDERTREAATIVGEPEIRPAEASWISSEESPQPRVFVMLEAPSEAVSASTGRSFSASVEVMVRRARVSVKSGGE